VPAARSPGRRLSPWPRHGTTTGTLPAIATSADLAQLDDVARRRVRTLVIVAILCAAGVLLVYLLAVHTHGGRELDQVAYEGRSVVRPRATQASERLLRTISRTSLALLGGALVLTALLRRRPRLALAVAVALGGAVVTTEVLKRWIFDRPVDPTVSGIPENSFPSGHATIGMSLALGLVVVVVHHWRWLAAIGAAFVATAFGTGVLTTGWHRPSDVVGAYLVSLAWYSFTMALLVRWRGPGDPQRLHEDVIEERAGPLFTMLVGALVLAALVVVLVASLDADGLRTVPYSRDYVLATLGIDVLGVAVVATFHLLMRDVSPDPRSAVVARVVALD
jgi:membrane-associated phospholipid phosphatase